jgi:hypothetical protein
MSLNTNKVALDFAPGLHGHFLEFVLNKYIFDVPFNDDIVFQSSGAFHVINLNREYQLNKVVHRGHFSSYDANYPHNVSKIIFIEHTPKLNFVLLTNIFYRCHPSAVESVDFNIEEINMLHKSFMSDLGTTDIDFRNNWYTKIAEDHFPHVSKKPKTSLPVYNFNLENFYNINDFCTALTDTAHFLEYTFKFDNSLATLWKEFMVKNQGWQLYTLGNSLLESMLLGENKEIPNDWKLHSYLNFCLGKMFNLFDGVLFNDTYPTDTLQLKKIIHDHIENFDLRW